MGTVPVFQNPYGPNGSSPTQIDKLVGSAYDVVREVAENLEYIKHVSAHLTQIYRIYQSIEGLDVIYEHMLALEQLLVHIDNIIIVAESIEDITQVADEINAIIAVSASLPLLSDIFANLDQILAHGGVVFVSDTAPTTAINGKLWWESDSGNLYAYYDDGDSGQWVQINISSNTYAWVDIADKPSTFPPSGHTHTELVKKTGDTMTGNLTVKPAVGNAALNLQSTGVTANVVFGDTVGVTGTALHRWAMLLGNTLPESGHATTGSTGSDFILTRYNNGGSIMDSPIHIPRATGIPNFAKGLTSKQPLPTSDDDTVATTAFVIGKTAGFSEITGDTFTVGGKDVIHVPQDPGILKYSLAIGDGLKLSRNDTGLEGMVNLSIGFRNLTHLTTGSYNVIGGFEGGERITTGSRNTGWGEGVLIYLVTGEGNSAFGHKALLGDPDGIGTWHHNTGLGYNALLHIMDGANNNLAVGNSAMYNSIGVSGQFNSGLGAAAMTNIESGNNNNSFGYFSLGDLTTGSNNIAIGHTAGRGLKSGSGNVVIGHNITGLPPTLTNNIIIGVGDGKRVLVGSNEGVAILGAVNDDAPLAGYVGEYKETIVPYTADIIMSNGVPLTVCQLSLTPGDWDVFGWVGFTTQATTTVTHLIGTVSMTAGGVDLTTPGASSNAVSLGVTPGASSSYFNRPAGYRRVAINVTDIVYLTALCNFTGGQPSVWGKIWARRAR